MGTSTPPLTHRPFPPLFAHAAQSFELIVDASKEVEYTTFSSTFSFSHDDIVLVPRLAHRNLAT